MIRFAFIFMVIVLSNSSQAQEIKINWNIQDSNISLNAENQYYANGRLNAEISRSYNSGTPEIISVNYINIDTLVFTDSIKASSDLDFEFNWGKSRDEYILDVNFNPLIISGEQKKLVSSFAVLIDDKVVTKNVLSKKTEFNFAENSVLSDGNWVKLAINKTGVFQIDYKLMKEIASALGKDIDDVNPENISIYGQKGGMLPEVNEDYKSDDLVELAIRIEGEGDLKFNKNDRVVFYAEGADEIGFDNGLFYHRKNIYTDETYVFITIKNNKGARVEKQKLINVAPDYKTSTYNDVRFHELENTNVLHSGQNWVGEDFDVEKDVSIKFNFLNRIVDKPVSVKSGIVYAKGATKKLNLKVNNTLLYTYNLLSKKPGGFDDEKNSSIYVGSEKDLDVSFNYTSETGEKLYLDYLFVEAECNLNATGNQLNFRSKNYNNKSGIKEYSISNKANLKEVWDVTNPLKVISENIIIDGDLAKFKAEDVDDSVAEYVMLSGKEYYTPTLVGKVKSQNLHLDKAVDYIIVSHGDFMASAKNLADFHRGKGLMVKVVEVDDIYNEFSAGRQDLVAIRQYVRMIYKKSIGSTNELKYLLMFGDASYDFKNRLEHNTNIVPSYHFKESIIELKSIVTDDFFTVMDLKEGGNISGRSNVMDIAVGRIPVHKIEDAENVVAKIVGYNTVETFGAWRNNIQFVVDDATNYNNSFEVELFKGVERLAVSLGNDFGIYNQQKVYLDTYKPIINAGLITYPKAHEDLMQNLQKGNLVTNYSGHGSEFTWTGNGLFNGVNDVEKLTNNKNLPLFVTITCSFSKYDNPEIEYSGGEKILNYANGGGIGLISTTREIQANAGSALHELMFKYLFSKERKYTIGEVLRYAKNNLLGENTRSTVSLLGDPALMLAYPDEEVVMTKVNEKEVDGSEVIESLMHVSIEGEVRKSGVINSSFNGEVNTVLFDKVDYRTSLNNNNLPFAPVDYRVQDNVIYKGISSVKAGKFTAEFIVPKDINYSVGNGKISFYAKSNLTDATGFNSEIKVGGVFDQSITDETGPDIEVFINDKLFADGGVTNSSPVLLMNLMDVSGINTVGNGIGHDFSVTVRKDGEVEKIKLNANYQSQIDDFTKGKAKYEFLGLEQGTYELEISAWDVYNNSSYKKISFIVQDDEKLVLGKVFNFPNPFKNETTFRFTHNKPNDILSSDIEIYTTTGQLVKTVTHNGIYNGFVAQDVKWDGTSYSGNKLKPGVYYYRIIVKTIDGKISNSDVGKLIISL
ncbi:MAG: type IX secretion system sortase PorU [Ichthyobacteriaceae bacterium]|nr:type IX secretion system sortase PorU [Ichthyobacteriaceae bacterium]